jgi:hypothetical protein
MMIRSRYLAITLLLLFGIAGAVAVTHLDSLPAFILIGPGYLAQAWFFETHRAIGGFGYQLTMVGVSAFVWTLIILGPVVAIRRFRHVVRRSRAA